VLGSDELAIVRIAQRRDLHEVPHAVIDAGPRQRQGAGVVDRLEGLRGGLTQDARDVDHRIHTVEQGVPVGAGLRL